MRQSNSEFNLISVLKVLFYNITPSYYNLCEQVIDRKKYKLLNLNIEPK